MKASHFGFSPRVRTLIQGCGRLALFVLVFQLVAVDHWRGSVAEIEGVENSQAHVLHCHAGASGCADSAGWFGLLPDVSLQPAAPAVLSEDLRAAGYSPSEAPLAAPDYPPRAS